MRSEEYRSMLTKTLYAIIICSLIVCISYYFVDREIATFVYKNQLSDYHLLLWMTYIPDVFWYGAPLLIIYIILKRAIRQTNALENKLFIASISLFITAGLENFLKFCFGRYWPETWVHNNPSFIQNDAYGFHPFHLGQAFQSFPSGHTAATFTVLTVFWLSFPKWRVPLGCLYLIVPIGLLGMNYHFFGDIIAGAFLGAIVANYCVRLSHPQNS